MHETLRTHWSVLARQTWLHEFLRTVQLNNFAGKSAQTALIRERQRAINHAGVNLQESLVVVVFAGGLEIMDAM
jgi:hypothetical protein